MMTAAPYFNPTGGRKNDALEAACMLRASGASGIGQGLWPEEFSIPKQWNNDHQACQEEIISHPLVVEQEDIPDMVTNWFHAVKVECLTT